MNEKLDQFGEERLTQLVEKNREKSSSELLNITLREVNNFMDNYPQHDDMTMVIIKRE